MEIIDDSYILNLEFLHDNKHDMDYMKKNNNFFDTINQKDFNIYFTKIINDKNKNYNPESELKEKIFNNVTYGKISINDKKFKKDIIDNKKFIFVFDNKQLSKEYLNQILRIFENDIEYKIFIPFIFLAEQYIDNNTKSFNDYIKSLKKDYKNIIIDNFYNDDNITLKEEYKIEADNIGFLFNKEKLINFKPFSNKNDNHENFIEQIELLGEYITNYSNNTNITFFNKIKNLNHEIIKINEDILKIINDKKLNEPTKAKNILALKNEYFNLKNLVLSLKEARDTYYLSEINNIRNKIIDNINLSEYNFVYVTLDEISNSRCILNKISTINMLDGIPRYFAYINKKNHLILKLFSIFYKYIIKINEEYKEIQKNNAKLILDNGKSIIKKNIIENVILGGFIKNYNIIKNTNNQKIDNPIYRNIITIKRMSSPENQIKIIDDLDYEQIKLAIENFTKNGKIYLSTLFDNLKLTIINLHNSNNEYIIIKNKLKEIFIFLIYLHKKIDYNTLVDKINDDNEKYKISLDSKCKIFMNTIKYVKDECINIYNEHYKNKIENINLDGIYILCFIDLFYSGINYQDKLESLEYIMPEIFEQYPIYEYYKIINIESTIADENTSDDD